MVRIRKEEKNAGVYEKNTNSSKLEIYFCRNYFCNFSFLFYWAVLDASVAWKIKNYSLSFIE